MRGEILPGSMEEFLLIEYFKRRDEFLISTSMIPAQASISTKEAQDSTNKLIGEIRMNFVYGDRTEEVAKKRKELADKLISQLPLTPRHTIDKKIFKSTASQEENKKSRTMPKTIRLKP
jgi:hypothetical protein